MCRLFFDRFTCLSMWLQEKKRKLVERPFGSRRWDLFLPFSFLSLFCFVLFLGVWSTWFDCENVHLRRLLSTPSHHQRIDEYAMGIWNGRARKFQEQDEEIVSNKKTSTKGLTNDWSDGKSLKEGDRSPSTKETGRTTSAECCFHVPVMSDCHR